MWEILGTAHLRPKHPVPREERHGTYCEDYEKYGCRVHGCPTGCYLALPD